MMVFHVIFIFICVLFFLTQIMHSLFICWISQMKIDEALCCQKQKYNKKKIPSSKITTMSNKKINRNFVYSVLDAQKPREISKKKHNELEVWLCTIHFVSLYLFFDIFVLDFPVPRCNFYHPHTHTRLLALLCCIQCGNGLLRTKSQQKN